jgi:hypothetical protein
MNTANSMHRDWDGPTRQDTFLDVVSWRKDWDEESFFKFGEQGFSVRLS